MKFVTRVVLLCVFLPILFLIIFTPKPHEHEGVTKYVFSSYNSTTPSYVRDECKECGTRLTYDSLIKGTLIDQSYLEAIEEHSDGVKIVPGEYYTVTATVPMGFVAYSSNRVRLNCKVENEDFIVFFNVEFREEFEEQVKQVEKGAEITFRGRFYDEGCGFTDSELIK